MDKITKKTSKFYFFDQETLQKNIRSKASGLFHGVDKNARKIDWLTFKKNFDFFDALKHFLEYRINPDYVAFLEEEFKTYKQVQTKEELLKQKEELENTKARAQIANENLRKHMDIAKAKYLKLNTFWECVRYDPNRKAGASITRKEAEDWLSEAEQALLKAKQGLADAKETLSKNRDHNDENYQKAFDLVDKKDQECEKLEELVTKRTFIVKAIKKLPEGAALVPNNLLELVNQKWEQFKAANALYSENSKIVQDLKSKIEDIELNLSKHENT